jgi:hypothetical protein
MDMSHLVIPLPSVDASTIAGQLQWFMYGFGVGSCLAAVSLAIRFLHRAGGGGNFEN